VRDARCTQRHLYDTEGTEYNRGALTDPCAQMRKTLLFSLPSQANLPVEQLIRFELQVKLKTTLVELSDQSSKIFREAGMILTAERLARDFTQRMKYI
jgi:hypothetical protein